MTDKKHFATCGGYNSGYTNFKQRLCQSQLGGGLLHEKASRRTIVISGVVGGDWSFASCAVLLKHTVLQRRKANGRVRTTSSSPRTRNRAWLTCLMAGQVSGVRQIASNDRRDNCLWLIYPSAQRPIKTHFFGVHARELWLRDSEKSCAWQWKNAWYPSLSSELYCR